MRMRLLPVLLPFAAMLASLAPGGVAAHPTIDLEFLPPQMEMDKPVCTRQEPDAKIAARWAEWDGGALPIEDPAIVRRDLRRLMLDGSRWFDTITLIIDRLEESDPRFRGQNSLLARIDALEAAGRYDELLTEQLVPQLAQMGDVLSAHSKAALSRFYRDGIGIARDQANAESLLMDAGYSGNADALLTLAEMTLDEAAPEDWEVPVDLSVSMAFGALVGELNAAICDRTTRIAHEYHNGTVVTRNPQLAHDWFRFAADMGDAGAAWKVVEYHLAAEDLPKDNEVLLKYLRQAADAGLPYALIELGRLYEIGALVEQDLPRALALYEKAAEDGGRVGLTRVALLLERHADAFPDGAARRVEALQALTKLQDAPGWAFARIAHHLIDTKGRWAGADAARPLLEEAAARGDLDGTVQLAKLLLSNGQAPENFDRAINLFAKAVSVNGGATPLVLLRGAYICHAPDAPRLEEAAHWQLLEGSTATGNLELTAQELIALDPETNPLEVAKLQSHALYGSPRALAGWLKLLEYADFADDELHDFWWGYSNHYTEVVAALARLEFELAESPSQREAAFGLLRSEYKRSGPSAALELAQALLRSHPSVLEAERSGDTSAAEAEALSLLHDLAAQGVGQAIQLLGETAPDEAGRRAIFDTYREVIANNGDFYGLVFAAPYLEGAAREEALHQAVGVMTCNYKNAMSLARLQLRLGDADAAQHWMLIAGEHIKNSTWAMTDLADELLQLDRPAMTQRAVELFTKADALGDVSAARRLFTLRLVDDSPAFDPEAAFAMLDRSLAQEDYKLIGIYLRDLISKPKASERLVEAGADLTGLARVAAEHGDARAMRSYGLLLRKAASSAGDIALAADWTRRAAEAGDTGAMAEYGEMLAFGIGVEPDADAAAGWLSRAAQHGSRRATELARLVQMRDGGDDTAP